MNFSGTHSPYTFSCFYHISILSAALMHLNTRYMCGKFILIFPFSFFYWEMAAMHFSFKSSWLARNIRGKKTILIVYHHYNLNYQYSAIFSVPPYNITDKHLLIEYWWYMDFTNNEENEPFSSKGYLSI